MKIIRYKKFWTTWKDFIKGRTGTARYRFVMYCGLELTKESFWFAPFFSFADTEKKITKHYNPKIFWSWVR